MPPKAAAKTSKAAKAPKKAGKSRAPARPKAAVAAAPGSLSKNGGGNGVPPRRKYRPFSEEESKALVVGVKRYGLGNWTRIHDDPDLPFMVRAFRSCQSSATPKIELESAVRAAQSTQRTPIDLKDKWRVLSKKLSQEELSAATPSGTVLAAGQVGDRPPQYSREHLVLLPYHELVTLVLSWQDFYHHNQRANGQANGQQITSTISVPYVQLKNDASLGSADAYGTAQQPDESERSGKRRKREGESNRAGNMPPSVSVGDLDQRMVGPSEPGGRPTAARARPELKRFASLDVAEQMTMLSPNLPPMMANHAPSPLGGSMSSGSAPPDSGSSFSPGASASAPMSPPTLSALSPPMKPMQGLPTVPVDRVFGRMTHPGRLPPPGSLADPRTNRGPKINLTPFEAHQVDGGIAAAPAASGSAVAGLHQNGMSSAALEMMQQSRHHGLDTGSEILRLHTGGLQRMALSHSSERLNERLNESAMNVFPIGRSQSSEDSFDTLRMVASRSVEELNNLAVRTVQTFAAFAPLLPPPTLPPQSHC